MIKNILLVVMSILVLVFFIFGYIQKIEADKQTELAIALKVVAEQSKMEEMKAKEMAALARAEADQQRVAAQEALAACEKGKKK